ncbi:CobW family GTP-binding protein [Haloferula chungangensis]|uniref:CobW family GTP-binding protein n=1 Tax=Haloferula chungangensis TaxID=1048331 RepID=A0ABW2L9S3_9BACT
MLRTEACQRKTIRDLMSRTGIPVLIVAGFLGAGKTTFIRDLLPRLAGGPLKPFVILNDHLNAEIDAIRLRNLGAEIETLPAGCVCCEDSSGLSEAVLAIPPSNNPLLIIEANGTTDPYRLIEILTLTQALRERVGPILQLTVLNEARFGKRLMQVDQHLEKLQIRTASAILTTRSGRASEAQKQKLRETLTALNPHAPLLGVEALANLLRQESHQLPAPDIRAAQEHTHHHIALRVDVPRMSKERLHRWLLSLPPEILRAKGVVQVSEEQICYFQRTDDAMESPTYHLARIPKNYRACAVFIGHGLSEKLVHATLESSAKPPAFRMF